MEDAAEVVAERDLLLQRVESLTDALAAATAFVELSTGNGVRKQPPTWAVRDNGEFDAQVIADRGRAVLAAGVSAATASQVSEGCCAGA